MKHNKNFGELLSMYISLTVNDISTAAMVHSSDGHPPRMRTRIVIRTDRVK